jgi:NHLM bacteriocin system ABC transporter ATP-binding protein
VIVLSDWLERLEKMGTRVGLEGNKTLLLTDESAVWLVASGKVEVFVAAAPAGKPEGIRHHLFSLQERELLMGIKPTGDATIMSLLVTGLSGAQLLRVTAASFWKEVPAAEAAALLEQWVVKFSIAGPERGLPGNCRQLGAGREQAVPQGATLRSRETVCWIRHQEGSSLLQGETGWVLTPADGYFPLGSRLWLRPVQDARLECLTTAAFLAGEAALKNLQNVNRRLLELAAAGAATAEQLKKQRAQQKKQLDFQAMKHALNNLADIIDRPQRLDFNIEANDHPLFAACKIVGDLQGIIMTFPPQPPGNTQHPVKIEEIAQASGIRYRRVALRGEWWQSDSGPLLGYLEENDTPVALVPASNHRYFLINPAQEAKVSLDRQTAAQLKPFAVCFYKPFPAKPVTIKSLLQFAFAAGWKSDLRMIAAAGLAGGLLGLVTPKVNAVVFDQIIPGGQKGELWQIAMLLCGAAVATAIFQLVRSFAVLRVKSAMDNAVQSAVWDRLLSLPVTFFKDYTAGELGMRAMSINQIRDVLSDTLVASILSSVFSCCYYIQMYYYSKQLALKALLLVTVSVAVTFALGLLQVKYQKKLIEAQNKLSGLLFQLLGGIAKLRISGSENRAFLQWTQQFGRQRKITFTAQNIANWLAVFNEIFPLAAAMALFYLVIKGEQVDLKTGDFIAFNIAMGSLISSMVQISGSFITVLGVRPLFDSVRPILTTAPEDDDAKQDPGELTGELEVDRVSFRYYPTGPLVLDHVSLQVKPGDYIAVVGPSGSGKSTLLRVLLGFEKPESGCVYYDGRDSAKTDLRAIRRQLGVVLQDGQLMPGDILTNIIGSHPGLTVKDAWGAAQMAGLAEEIRKMPMGMYTMVSEGAGTLSGGQRQRLMIARAIVNRPRLIYFDEATSALDNLTQSIVGASLDKLNATRIVIAHRLSTVKNCDRIYVMDQGQIVEQGSYEELMAQAGLFADLAQRQLA